MKLPKISVENHQFTLILFLLLVGYGVMSFFSMPRTEDPPLRLPGTTIIAIYPGGNPADLEELIANPIEETLNELEDIKVVETAIREGVAVVSIEFTFGTNPDDKFDEVIRQVNGIRNDLPPGLYSLDMVQWTSSDVIMTHLAMVSDEAEYSSFHKYGEELKKRLERQYGVKSVEILAIPEQQVKIMLDLEKMARMNIGVQQAELAIQSNNANIPGGAIEVGEKSFNLRTSGTYQNLEEIKRTVVGSFQGRLIYLENISEVKLDYEEKRYHARYLGEKAVFLAIKQKEGYNIFDIVEGIDQEIEAFTDYAGDEIRLEKVFDQSESVSGRVNNFLSNLFFGILLVGILVFLSLGFRASVIVILAIPFSIIIGLGMVDLAGFGLQQISIAGLIISLGLLVDNSIVITENIERFIEEGYQRREAAIKASAQLGWPIVTATFTTLFAFIPIITMPDKAGKFIQSLPVTVSFTLLASLFLALSLTPYLSSIFLKERNSTAGKNQRKGFRHWINRFSKGPYRRLLIYSLKNSWLIILLSTLALAGSLFLFSILGKSFFPKAERPLFMIRIDTPEGTTMEMADNAAQYVEYVLDTIPDVKKYATNIGHGNPRIYYNIFPRQNEKSFAEIYVELWEYEVNRFDQLVSRLRDQFSQYPGARITIKEFEQGTPMEAPLTIKITGPDLDRLLKISREVESFVYASDGAVNIDNQVDKASLELFVNINREKAGILGVPIFEIDRTIRATVAGMPVSTFRGEEGKDYPMVLYLSHDNKISIEDFNRIYVKSLSGAMIPVSQLASLELIQGPGVITHYNMERSATITADIIKGYSLDEVVASIEEEFRNYQFPDGYTYKYTGELESREESFGGIIKASIIALLAIIAILVLQFRSFSQPFIIFSALPLAVIGSTLALYITGNSFSFTAGIGFISLIGIVVNNAIILVDYANKLQTGGKDLVASLVEAGETRFRPIILTTLTTIGGLLPLTLRGGTLWAPLGWTIIGGLLVSTILTLLVVPVLYKVFSPNPK